MKPAGRCWRKSNQRKPPCTPDKVLFVMRRENTFVRTAAEPPILTYAEPPGSSRIPTASVVSVSVADALFGILIIATRLFGKVTGDSPSKVIVIITLLAIVGSALAAIALGILGLRRKAGARDRCVIAIVLGVALLVILAGTS
jgi:hypothetical protein